MPNRDETPSALLAIGRGLEIYDFPVALEPSIPSDFQARSQYHPFHCGQDIDDGRHPGLIESLFQRRPSSSVSIQTPNVLSGESSAPVSKRAGCPMTELQISLPQTSIVTPELTERLLLNLANRSVPVALEIIGTADEVQVQFAVRDTDAEQAERHIKAHFNESKVSKTKTQLSTLLQSTNLSTSKFTLIIDFGLRRQILHSLNTLRSFEPDPLIGLVSGLSNLGSVEICVFQVLFQTVREDWRGRFIAELTDSNGQHRFMESKELLSLTIQKFSRPLLAVSVRLCVVASDRERAMGICRGQAGIFQPLASPNGNELVALRCEESSLGSLVNRTSHRSGMLLNVAELACIAHLPSASVVSEKLKRNDERTKKAPQGANDNSILLLGENSHDGHIQNIGLSAEQFTRHMFICGGSGGGKSTLLCNSVRQVVEQGFGCAVIDPAGDLIDDIMSVIPDSRLDDIILFDASDAEYPVGFNPLEAYSETEKYLLSSDLVALFRRYSTAWGSLMEAAVAQAVNAFLYNSRTGSLADLKRFLIEKDFRREVLQTVEDDSVRYFWNQESSGINAKSLASVLIRLDGFLRHPLIRNIVCQRTKLNFRDIIEQRKILLIKVSQGLIGQENAALLGSFLISKLYQIALSRQDTNLEKRKSFWLFADEVQNYLTPSLGLILAGTRKYGVGLTMATQSFRTLQNQDADVAESILANCFTRICFRLGDEDAKRFAQGFSFFSASDVQNLSVGHAIARIERSDFDFNLKTFPMAEVLSESADQKTQRIIANTRRLYATPRSSVEAEIQAGLESPRIKVPAVKPAHKTVSKANNEDLAELGTSQVSIEPSFGEKITNSNQGRGGRHHQELQAVIKRVAETYGYRVEIEQNVLDGSGRVDISIENENLKIACEVSVTTTHYEVTNILKCLTAGFDFVVVVVSNQKKIPLLNTKIRSEIPVDHQDKVKTFGLTGLLGFLRELSVRKESTGKTSEKPTGHRLNFTQACEFFDVTASTLYRWVGEGRVPFYRPGREYQFDRDELVLIGKHDLSGKRKASVKLSPLNIDKRTPKGKKDRNSRYRKLLKLD